jgi:RNA polymerase sigma-70 factor (ECF subfamily)
MKSSDYFKDYPDLVVIDFARAGDKSAFEELLKRKQSAIRNLMRRFCGDLNLADDLAQQVCLQLWLKLRFVKRAEALDGWLRKVAVSIWLQHLRKHDAIRGAEELSDLDVVEPHMIAARMDLDTALATLPDTARVCVVLSYHEGLSHREIATLTSLPLGTVKSHIQRGATRLQRLLAAYDNNTKEDRS